MKSVYVIQPYKVGSKKAKSLAMVIPSKVVKKYNIDASTIFTLRPDDKNEIRLRVMDEYKKVVRADMDGDTVNEQNEEDLDK